MKKSKFIKSEAEDQFEIDEQMVDEIADSDEFKDVEITNEDIMDAIQAIDALADAVIEKADAEEKELDADTLLDEVRDMIDDVHEDEEVEVEEEEELPEELTNSAVRVMVSEDGAIEVEQTPDEVYDSEIDGMDCTVYDTCALPPVEVEDTGDTDENTEDDMLVIGNSKAKKFKKGFVKLTSSRNKKAWSAAYKKVKKMIGNAKMTPAHWAIVSAIAKKEEEEDKKKKKLECALLKKIRSNKVLKSRLLKSSDEFDTAGQPISDTKPEDTVGEGNNGYEEIGEPTEMKSPEVVDSQSGNPVVDPDKEVEGNADDVVLPEGEMIVLEVPLTNSKKKVMLKKVHSSKIKNFNAYKVRGITSAIAKVLDGKVLKSGKVAYIFKDTANGLLACSAKFVDSGKGKYTTVLKNGKITIARGKSYNIFNSIERFMNTKAILNARKDSISSRKSEIVSRRNRLSDRKPMVSSRRNAVLSAKRREALKERILNARKARLNSSDNRNERLMKAKLASSNNAVRQAKREVIKSKVEARQAVRNVQRIASQNEQKLRQMHDNEERQRLFQSSQAVMNEEKIAIKQNVNRNSEALATMYDNMF